MTKPIKILIGLILVPYVFIAQAYVGATAFNWLVPFIYPEAPTITMGQFFCLVFMIAFLNPNKSLLQNNKLESDEEQTTGEKIFRILFEPWLMLLIAYIIKLTLID